VAKGKGQSELALAKPITLSKDVAKNPDPSIPGGASANFISLIIIFLKENEFEKFFLRIKAKLEPLH
jgi:hypothetical protein